MSLKFASNLSFMFMETPSIIERYKLAKEAGFKAVESGFPFGFSVKDVTEAKTKAGLEQILINVYTGDVSKGELGFAAIPGEEENFKKSIDMTIEYAKALHCKRIHVMSGKVNQPTSVNDDVYEKSLLYAAEKFQKEGILGVIEPINSISVPNYYMNSFEKGLNVVKKINNPNLKLLLDVFHLQHICGNITKNIKELLPYIGHVQIAQVPDRHEPDTPGEIDYKYVLSVLEKEGYSGYVGLEYRPKSSSVEGLSWMQKYGYNF
ncbi:PREDICTED: putative hydroxypyruvate isomerase [Dufourea novaeangliae]|uniref:Putative hydroxypyruvate isomerase n=1 Tax=Dufourea novaeangliae TaxID=178035 RepID=A0A154PHV7_DUFNO|nr:PREDICTED: putative hydroxypyruvate isomerase [Dufourea novaeangliae]KZC10780.1 Putative hydroxypyruvate isomerase [Dufourea novaeangliae]